MNVFDAAGILLVLAALFSFLNYRFLRLPSTVALLLSGLLASGVVLGVDALVPAWGLGENVREAVLGIDFTELLMHGMLSLLLFAGALHVNLEDLLKKKTPILTLASVGVLISTGIIGFGSHWIFLLSGIHVPLAYCLVFGALISPTDPIAVLGIMKNLKTPKSLEIKVAGESLFNDGIGVVVFSILLGVAGGVDQGTHGIQVGLLPVALLFLGEVLGGVALGFVGGYIVYWAMKSLDEHNLETLLSLALVMGITVIAFQVHTSAPLACVVAGLFIGNHGRRFAMSERTRQALDDVWSLADYTLNAILFLLLGLEVVAVSFGEGFGIATLLMVPLSLIARFLCVSFPVLVLRLRHDFSPGVVRILTWGGLRGGISVALALSLPEFPGRSTVMAATYSIVIFSIVVQGLTVGRLIQKIGPAE